MRVAIFTHPDPATTGRYFERAALADGDQLVTITSEDDARRLEPNDFLLAVDPFYSPWPAWLKEVPCKTAAYLIDVHQNLELRVAAGRFFDCVFSAQKDYLSVIDHPRKLWLPLAGDPDVHFFSHANRSLDVGFVGKLGSAGSDRRNTLLHVLSNFNTNDFSKKYTPVEMGEVYSSSKIVFNKSINRDLNMRAFEAWAAGALLVTDRIDNGLSEVATEGVHYVGYDTDKEAVEAIQFYLLDEERRNHIAAAGQANLNAHHTYLHRWRQVKREIGEMGSRAPARLQSQITVHRWNSEMLALTGAPPREALDLLRRPGLSLPSVRNALIAVARFASRSVRGFLAARSAR